MSKIQKYWFMNFCLFLSGAAWSLIHCCISVSGPPCWAGAQRRQEKNKGAGLAPEQPQTDFRLLFCSWTNFPLKYHLLQQSDGTIIFPYQQFSNTGNGKSQDNVSKAKWWYQLWFIGLYLSFFLFGLAFKSDLFTVTVILSSPLRFYLTFKWI